MNTNNIENYIKKIDMPNYQPVWIDSFIYVYKNPDKIPIHIWLDKLDEDVDYFEKIYKFRFIKKYDEFRNEIIENYCFEIQKEIIDKWRNIVINIINKHPGSWFSIYASEIIFKSETSITIGIINYTKEKQKNISNYLDELNNAISVYIGSRLNVDFKDIQYDKFWENIPFSFKELVNEPQVYFNFLSEGGDLNHADKLISLNERKIHLLNEDIIRFKGYQKEYKERINKLDTLDTRKWKQEYKVIDLILKNELEKIHYSRLIGTQSEYCAFEIKKFFTGSKKCYNKAINWDIFCSEHSSEFYQIHTKLIREKLIFNTSNRLPELDNNLLQIEFAAPTENIVKLRKKINKISEELLLKQWEKSLKDDSDFLNRLKVQNIFLNKLKPIYEKYNYLKFGRPPIPMTTKLKILKQSDFKCVLCKADLLEKEPHIDHIIPLHKGGGSDVSNLQALCWECNLKKGTKVL